MFQVFGLLGLSTKERELKTCYCSTSSLVLESQFLESSVSGNSQFLDLIFISPGGSRNWNSNVFLILSTASQLTKHLEDTTQMMENKPKIIIVGCKKWHHFPSVVCMLPLDILLFISLRLES